MLRKTALSLLLVCLGGCRWQPSEQIEVQVRAPESTGRGLRGNPTDPLALQCFFVTVVGDDVSSTLASKIGAIDTSCLEIGALSSLATKEELLSNGIKVTVSAGTNRRVRLLGVQGITQSCDQTDLATLLANQTTLQVFSLGESRTDLYKDTEVTIENSYQSSTATELISHCTGTSPTPTAAVSGLGTLERIYVGSAANDFDASDIDRVLPPTNSAGQFGRMTSLPITADAVGANAQVLGFNPLPAGGVDGHIRVDLIFSATIQSGWFYRVKVEGTAGSSFFDGEKCLNAFQTMGILSMALWDQGSVNWDSVAVGTSIQVAGPESVRPLESGDLVTAQYYHVSLRSDAVSSWDSVQLFGSCSALRLTRIFTEEYNPVRASSNLYYGR